MDSNEIEDDSTLNEVDDTDREMMETTIDIPPPPTCKINAKMNPEEEIAMIQGIVIGLQSVQLDHLNLATSIRLKKPNEDWNLLAKTLVSAVRDPLKACFVQKFEKKHSLFMREYLWKHFKWAAQIYSKGGKHEQSKMESCKGYQLIQRAFNNRNQTIAKTSPVFYKGEPLLPEYPICQLIEMSDTPPKGISPHLGNRFFSPKSKLDSEQEAAMITGIEIGLQSMQLDHLNLQTSVQLEDPDKDWNLLAKTLVAAVKDPLKACYVQRFEKKHSLFMREYLWKHYKWAAQVYSKGGKNMQCRVESCKGYQMIQRAFNNRNQTIRLAKLAKTNPICFKIEPDIDDYPCSPMTDESRDQMEGEEMTWPMDPTSVFLLPDSDPRPEDSWNYNEDDDPVGDEMKLKTQIKTEQPGSPENLLLPDCASSPRPEDDSTFNQDDDTFNDELKLKTQIKTEPPGSPETLLQPDCAPSPRPEDDSTFNRDDDTFKEMSDTLPLDISTLSTKYLSLNSMLDPKQEEAMIKGIEIGLQSVQLDHLNLQTSVLLENPDKDWNLVAKTLVAAVKDPLKACFVQRFEKKHSLFMREYLWKNYKWAAQVYSKGGKNMQSRVESCKGYQLIQRAFNNRNQTIRLAKQIVDYPITQESGTEYTDEGIRLPTAKWSYMTIESKQSYYKLNKTIREMKEISSDLLNMVKVSWDATIAYLTSHENIDLEHEVTEGNLAHLGILSSYLAHVTGLYDETEGVLDRFRVRMLLLSDFFADNLGTLVKVNQAPSQSVILKRPFISTIQILAGLFGENPNIIYFQESKVLMNEDEYRSYGCSIIEVSEGNYGVLVQGVKVMSNLTEVEASFVFATAMDAYWSKEMKISKGLSNTMHFLRKYILDRMTVSSLSVMVDSMALPFLHHALRKTSIQNFEESDITQKLAGKILKLLQSNNPIVVIDKENDQ